MTRGDHVILWLINALIWGEIIYGLGLGGLYHLERTRRRNLEKRLKQVIDQMDIEAAFTRAFEIMEQYLGGISRISCKTVKDGSHVIHVHCLHCQKENRLGKGLKGAHCGQCKRLLSEPPVSYAGSHQVEATKKLVN